MQTCCWQFVFFERFVFILWMVRISCWIEGLKEKYWHFQEGRGVDYAKILFVDLTSRQKKMTNPWKCCRNLLKIEFLHQMGFKMDQKGLKMLCVAFLCTIVVESTSVPGFGWGGGGGRGGGVVKLILAMPVFWHHFLRPPFPNKESYSTCLHPFGQTETALSCDQNVSSW